MTEQTISVVTGRADRPALPQNDTLAVLALIFGFIVPPLGIYLGHASCTEAVMAGRRRSALTIAGMGVGYAIVTAVCLLTVAGAIGMATGHGRSASPCRVSGGERQKPGAARQVPGSRSHTGVTGHGGLRGTAPGR